ncbi:hypothetical protein [Paeniglutamicibacter cryotolerans]|uniref:Uncharacterized protein n=1 Tax=Paeniglutamicibacter cryotolerans TaxID=670079 RepID=A0A839QLR5_9MICC|nr:hypothetical protein [Paeniglutamicibacter cryotolerans]MBB2997368.1 hypothetical protein [Paeniglutamicibacter cryotolerans]
MSSRVNHVVPGAGAEAKSSATALVVPINVAADSRTTRIDIPSRSLAQLGAGHTLEFQSEPAGLFVK